MDSITHWIYNGGPEVGIYLNMVNLLLNVQILPYIQENNIGSCLLRSNVEIYSISGQGTKGKEG